MFYIDSYKYPNASYRLLSDCLPDSTETILTDIRKFKEFVSMYNMM